MRSYPTSNDEEKELELLKAEDWQINCLKLNPNYVYWGNKEDYMISGKSWAERVYLDSVKDLWELDDYNELINFYFEVQKEDELPTVLDYLREARDRNAARFSKL